MRKLPAQTNRKGTLERAEPLPLPSSLQKVIISTFKKKRTEKMQLKFPFFKKGVWWDKQQWLAHSRYQILLMSLFQQWNSFLVSCSSSPWFCFRRESALSFALLLFFWNTVWGHASKYKPCSIINQPIPFLGIFHKAKIVQVPKDASLYCSRLASFYKLTVFNFRV